MPKSFKSVLGTYLLSRGIVHLSSYVDIQQNGVAERKNRHLLEVARSLMFSTHVPKHFWGKAVLTTTYFINRMPSRVLKFQTPCQVLLQIFPHTKIISSLDPKIFRCSVFVHIHQQYRSKLDPKSIKCIFLGYSPNQKGYKCYSPITKKVYNMMDVTFFEHQSCYPKFEIQGENMREYQLWDISGSEFDHSLQPGDIAKSFQNTLTNDHTPQNSILEQTKSYPQQTKSHPQQTESHPPTTPIQSPVHNHSEPAQIPNHELRVYAKRKRPEMEIKHPIPLTLDQDSKPSPKPA